MLSGLFGKTSDMPGLVVPIIPEIATSIESADMLGPFRFYYALLLLE